MEETELGRASVYSYLPYRGLAFKLDQTMVTAFEPIYSQIGLNYLTLCSKKTDICAFAFNISRFAEQTLIHTR